MSYTEFLNTDPFDAARAAADYIAAETGVDSHDVALVLGSGWGDAAELIGETTATMSAAEIPGFSAPSVVGHVGTIRSVLTKEGKRALVLGARTHYYEGKGVRRRGARRAHRGGRRLQDLVLTNGCGGLNENWRPAAGADQRPHQPDGRSPLDGATFVDLTDLYSPRLAALPARSTPRWRRASTRSSRARTTRPRPRSGWPSGRRRPGGHVDGAGGHRRPARPAWRFLACRLVSNLAAGISPVPLSHGEVLEAGEAAGPRISKLLAEIIAKL